MGIRDLRDAPGATINDFASEIGWAMSIESIANKQSRNSQEADDVSESPK